MTRLSLYLLFLIPLAISPFSLDAFMVPKFSILIIYSCVALFSLLFHYKKLYTKTDLRLKVFFFLFFLVLVFSFISSKTPWEQQFFGREGRNNGFLLFISLLLLMIFSAQIDLLNFKIKINRYIALSSLAIISYSILQLLELDPLAWNTINLKMFSTLGNPNFLSAFLAATFVPVLIYLYSHSIFSNKSQYLKFALLLFTFLVYGGVIFKSKSNQGLIIIVLSAFLLVILFSFRTKKIFLAVSSSCVLLFFGVVGILGTLNKGVLASILYKTSVTSRGDFYRSALNMGMDNWLHGVGIDGFGDYYLAYRDSTAAVRPSAEYADTAHNYFLDFFANLGGGGLILYTLLILFTFIGFIKLLQRSAYDNFIISIFIFWVGVQIQSLISPTFIVFLIYNFAFAGFVINHSKVQAFKTNGRFASKDNLNKTAVVIGLLLALLILLPFISKDRNLLKAQQGDSFEAVLSAARAYPKSIVTYNRILQTLANSGASSPIFLEVAKEAASFNPRTLPGQFTIMTSEYSSNLEKQDAYKVLLDLDPKNPIVEKYRP
jgi:O-antigen ligase